MKAKTVERARSEEEREREKESGGDGPERMPRGKGSERDVPGKKNSPIRRKAI